jgi:glutamate racemase
LRIVSERMPIGIFDSGVGGLTVMREIVRQLPEENILYLGDTARVPYGTRSPVTVIRYSVENTSFLISKGIKLLVVACNTSSSVSLDLLKEKFAVPVIGVVDPGARAAVAATRLKKIAVIGTETTIGSGSYEKAIEEGWLEGEVVTLTAKIYLSPVKLSGADTLVLGCTHYPMIKRVVTDVVNNDATSGEARISLIDSAVETAGEVKRVLGDMKMLRRGREEGEREFFVTDAPEKFARTGERFLGHKITNISKISLEG